MTKVSAELISALREKTGAGIMDCKRALEECGCDVEKAVDLLRQRGLAKAAKRAGKVTGEGVIGAYIHAGGKIGVLVEVNCETDFVARTPEFQAFVKDIAMHIAASNPKYIRREEVPEEEILHEKRIYMAQARESGKPEAVLERIAEGRLEKYFQEVCLMDQPFIKNQDINIKTLLDSLIARLGENIRIRRFARFQIGEKD